MSALALKLIFSRMRLRYVLTVLTLRLSSFAMSETPRPAANLQNIWNSRVDSRACRGLSGSPSRSATRISARAALT